MTQENRTPILRIVQIDLADVTPGSLMALFKSGAVAVQINGDPRIRRLWDCIIPHMAGVDINVTERLPWECGIAEIARNHRSRSGLDCIGDVLHFSPERIAYIGRKLEVTRDGETGNMLCDPPAFIQDGQWFRPDDQVLKLCWDIGSDILAGFITPGLALSKYRVVMHRLKYEQVHKDIENMFALIKSTVGRWSQLGYRLDHYRETARGPFARWGLRDIFAILRVMPGLGKLMQWVNDLFAVQGNHAISERTRLIGKHHFDGRIFSALCGDRDTIRTEVFDGANWYPLPISLDTLLVFPGLGARRFGVRPTLHRVLHTNLEDSSVGNAPNVTLLIGARNA